MGSEAFAPGAARLCLVDGVPLLRPDEQVFTAMLAGWRNQQLARNLAFGTIEARSNAVRAFALWGAISRFVVLSDVAASLLRRG